MQKFFANTIPFSYKRLDHLSLRNEGRTDLLGGSMGQLYSVVTRYQVSSWTLWCTVHLRSMQKVNSRATANTVLWDKREMVEHTKRSHSKQSITFFWLWCAPPVHQTWTSLVIQLSQKDDQQELRHGPIPAQWTRVLKLNLHGFKCWLNLYTVTKDKLLNF